ncbi:MAG: SGNH/GDSL hydrolase family protein [Chitinophagaceae bacterium]|nr:SGNH/GDSL hydrolase family protein [Chitinophagaceae bacterium]
MRTIFFLSLIMGCFTSYGQTASDRAKIAASQAGASPLFFDPFAEKIPAIGVSDFSDPRELIARGGLPNFFAKLKAGKPVTVGFIGGSITQALYGYRIQTARYIQSAFPQSAFKWMNAGVSGTGTDLGACRIYEQILKHDPDLVFVEFAVNGGYPSGMEGIVRQIIRNNPATDICFIYTVLNPQAKLYLKPAAIPENIQLLEDIAAHYRIPGIHLGIEAATLEANDKLVWKGETNGIQDKIVFSADGIHPSREGGNLYAAAIARSMRKLSGNAVAQPHKMPAALIPGNWEDAKMLDPLEFATFSKGWTKTKTAKHAFLKQFSGWFPYVMEAEEPGSSFSFKFKGTMFGIFDIGGPEVGQLSIKVDGKEMKLQDISGKGFRLYKANPVTGDDLLNLFNSFCNNRYRGQYDLIATEDGEHTVCITISEQKADKGKILGEKQLKDITENPEKYDRTALYLGKILLRGEIIK